MNGRQGWNSILGPSGMEIGTGVEVEVEEVDEGYSDEDVDKDMGGLQLSQYSSPPLEFFTGEHLSWADEVTEAEEERQAQMQGGYEEDEGQGLDIEEDDNGDPIEAINGSPYLLSVNPTHVSYQSPQDYEDEESDNESTSSSESESEMVTVNVDDYHPSFFQMDPRGSRYHQRKFLSELQTYPLEVRTNYATLIRAALQFKSEIEAVTTQRCLERSFELQLKSLVATTEPEDLLLRKVLLANAYEHVMSTRVKHKAIESGKPANDYLLEHAPNLALRNADDIGWLAEADKSDLEGELYDLQMLEGEVNMEIQSSESSEDTSPSFVEANPKEWEGSDESPEETSWACTGLGITF
ncbi:hypothetical protein TREMEDRAFT_61312 [Tremella mesenterica DSM 1558]|uniref:uncharacterized protein n=1 Tax=Tremella mesenterica (strain ATCC 24925 / CBS 8224 / DSM 1558 / NBRC 9311 / NRRL Y-6157 / RJB 2259-6 / UBC 559-6) TaxID=578456 RepID=UPI0003F48C49|nr:uncharacterized protein TREMEDRAFT_61312 [Tremella mesenterica DSM 1558]EIW70805.1 hypothetical protein TREMEDRAFT_61312 [Tremella mesenterica DSM 1558]